MTHTNCPNPAPSGPDFKTKGAWITLGTFIVSGLVLTGVIATDNEESIGGIVTTAIAAAAAVIAQGVTSYKYIKDRRKAKDRETEEKKPPTKPSRRKPRGTRTSQRTSRRTNRSNKGKDCDS